MRLLMLFSREEINRTGYPVIVEGWDKRKSGRVRRAYLETFSEEERNSLTRIYPKLYRWYLVTGVEEGVLSCKTYELIKKAANFFATI